MATIYISGKITGIEEEAFQIFETAEKELSKQGLTVVNPMALPHNHDKSWKSYMKECIENLLHCDSIYMLNNWENSRGAKIELDLAINLGINVIFQK